VYTSFIFPFFFNSQIINKATKEDKDLTEDERAEKQVCVISRAIDSDVNQVLYSSIKFAL